MWQITFPFPYKEKGIVERFRLLSDTLIEAYNARRTSDAEAKLSEYLKSRAEFAAKLSPDDYRYASFQLWQEGVARYTQIKMAELAARQLKPSKAFRKLKDYSSIRAEADRLLKGTLDELQKLDMVSWERTAFYPFGAVEGLLLDQTNPNWRGKYFNHMFTLETFFAAIKTR